MADTTNTNNIDEIVSGVREDLRTGETLHRRALDLDTERRRNPYVLQALRSNAE